MNKQDELNERFRAYATERFAKWPHEVVLPDAPYPSDDSLALTLPNPRSQEWLPLEVTTEDERLTVSLGNHHAHLHDEDIETLLRRCFELVDGILEERIVSVFLYHQHKPSVSDFCHVEDLPTVEKICRPPANPGFLERQFGPVDEPDTGPPPAVRSYGPAHYFLAPPYPGPWYLEVKSWLGTHDRRTEVAAPKRPTSLREFLSAQGPGPRHAKRSLWQLAYILLIVTIWRVAVWWIDQ